MTATVRDFCLRILCSGDLPSKLTAPAEADLPRPRGAPGAASCGLLDDACPSSPVSIDRPAREPALALVSGADPLPRPGALGHPQARIRCLARFAHHELMAVELFAWALLRWPEAPRALRRTWLGILRDEQRHCLLYLARLRAHGSDLSEHALSGYFWRHVSALGRSPAGPRAFLAAMGLTLEQANLDFAPLYGEGFRRGGDEASARVCAEVHADEIRHVRAAAAWLRKLAPQGDDVARYDAAVPYPLSAARAKGRTFDAEARRRAGLEEAFIEHVRTARSSQETRRPSARPRR